MASKNLKAVVVSSAGSIPVADPEKIKAIGQQAAKKRQGDLPRPQPYKAGKSAETLEIGPGSKMSPPGARLVAVCDLDAVSARNAAGKWGVEAYSKPEDLLKITSLDAVVIATPTFSHVELVIAAANAGRAVLCEKLLAITDEVAEAMDEAVRRNSVPFVMAFMRRFDLSFNRAWNMIRRGDIGEPLVVKYTGKGSGLPPPWNLDLEIK